MKPQCSFIQFFIQAILVAIAGIIGMVLIIVFVAHILGIV